MISKLKAIFFYDCLVFAVSTTMQSSLLLSDPNVINQLILERGSLANVES